MLVARAELQEDGYPMGKKISIAEKIWQRLSAIQSETAVMPFNLAINYCY